LFVSLVGGFIAVSSEIHLRLVSLGVRD